ncbi:response regulator [Pseudorhodoplanes sp.]|uniref:response regulator n=1 Tax=Pseudorhodoplanes sp. TaxID=1934341 RepID=UPI003D120D39
MRILLADDHDLLRDVLKAYLEALDLGISVQDVRSLDDAVALVKSSAPFDLILLDVDMPGMRGVSGLVRMREEASQIPVAILSGLNDPNIVVDALRAGAAGFIPKSIGARAMVSVIQLILAGERYIPSLLVDQVNSGLAIPQDEESAKAQKVSLTDEEETVLRLLREGASNKEIARELNVEEYTVKYYMRGLFKKLGAKNRTHAVTIGVDHDGS